MTKDDEVVLQAIEDAYSFYAQELKQMVDMVEMHYDAIFTRNISFQIGNVLQMGILYVSSLHWRRTQRTIIRKRKIQNALERMTEIKKIKNLKLCR